MAWGAARRAWRGRDTTGPSQDPRRRSWHGGGTVFDGVAARERIQSGQFDALKRSGHVMAWMIHVVIIHTHAYASRDAYAYPRLATRITADMGGDTPKTTRKTRVTRRRPSGSTGSWAAVIDSQGIQIKYAFSPKAKSYVQDPTKQDGTHCQLENHIAFLGHLA